MTGIPETVPTGAVVVLSVLLGLTGLGMVVVGRLGSTGRIRRNPLVGIRTARSMESDESWRTVHRTAAPWLYASGGMPLAAVVAMPFVRNPAPFLAVALGSLGLLVVFLCLGVRRGTRALLPRGS
ncbi:SdpI family protein [Streptomyces sp. NPDC021093]|uniref:SdpI family protein n=1 Tax=Streptomyces sp. NPDC021093 TaxID=3365112 RepID=UPI003791BE1A